MSETPDDRVREILEERGDDGTIPRDTRFYFYGGTIDGLREAAIAEGYETFPTVGKPGLILQIKTKVDEDAFNPLVEKMLAWAERFDCEFDGWETEILRN